MDDSWRSRITVRSDQMGGVACIRGLRIPVATIVGMLANGMDAKQVIDAYPDLEPEDIHSAFRYAATVPSETASGFPIPNP